MPASKRPPVHEIKRVVGYIRVSTREQAGSGLGLDDQRAKIRSEAEHRGWEVEIIEDKAVSGKNLDRRGMRTALRLLARGEADALLVAKLDRVTRSLKDFADLMETARRQGWAVIALDLGVDTTTAAGEMMANVLATFAQYERRLIGERTRDALAAARERGTRLGRPVTVPGEVERSIRNLRATGKTLREIAEHLNVENVPTAQGGARWHASTVRGILQRAA